MFTTAKYLKPEVDLVSLVRENRKVVLRNKGRSNSTNREYYLKALELVEAGVLKIVYSETTKSGQRSIIVELA